MQLQDLTSVIGAAVSVVAAAYSVAQTRVQHRREDFELARSLHADLTAGPVADARDLLGTVAFGKAFEHQLLDTQDIRRSYYVLLWCFERILGGRRSMRSRSKRQPNPAVDYLDDLIGWHVASWFVNFPAIRTDLEKRTKTMLDDRQSRAAYEELFLQLFGTDPVAKFTAVGLTPPSDLPEQVERLKAVLDSRRIGSPVHRRSRT